MGNDQLADERFTCLVVHVDGTARKSE